MAIFAIGPTTPMWQGLPSSGLLLVMPEGDDSCYTNSAEKPQNRYEDYIIKDLIADVESKFSACDRSRRAIVGVSMGGYGAVKIARRPELSASVSPS
jgi:S-formylglutathione hydrolase FrmB